MMNNRYNTDRAITPSTFRYLLFQRKGETDAQHLLEYTDTGPVCIVVLVLAYLSFLVIVFARYRKSSERLSKKASKLPSARVSAWRPSANPNQVLPNGYRRRDYHRYGYSDFDIEFLGLDQPSAPDPFFSGWVIADMADEDLDGDIDFF